ncbi:hypothetical protein C8R44DRAFT_809316 [Mycena epipterygia]|nr:hypothetical protein C8R44DRAFT_809316 [Mycena epipterygia]
MALRKVTEDEWTSLGVKSTFAINMPESPSSQVSGALTEICGWGWRFSCSIDATSISPPPILMNTDSNVIPWRRVTLFFHPDLIRQAAYGRIAFLTQEENLVPLDNVPLSKEFDVPDRSGINPPLGAYMYRSDTIGVPTISISVQFGGGLGMALPRPLDARVQEALADTLHGDEVVDVKFYAYTRRLKGGSVACPRPMFAKMALVRGHSDDLDAFISGGEGFVESVTVDLDSDLHSPEDAFAEYGYMSDSDLDSDEEEQELQVGSSGTNVRTLSAASQPPDCKTISLPASRPTSPAISTPRRMGHIVVVKGHAYKTWNALLYYLYTKKIVFSSLDHPRLNTRVSRIPECSPKSMYKLADAFGLDDLKNLALVSLRSQLSPENIVQETFSSFTSVYPEIQDIEVQFLIEHLPSLQFGSTGEIDEVLRKICGGVKPHCFDVLRMLVLRTGSVKLVQHTSISSDHSILDEKSSPRAWSPGRLIASLPASGKKMWQTLCRRQRNRDF